MNPGCSTDTSARTRQLIALLPSFLQLRGYQKVFFLPSTFEANFVFVCLGANDGTTGSLGFTALGFLASRLLRFLPFDMAFPS